MRHVPAPDVPPVPDRAPRVPRSAGLAAVLAILLTAPVLPGDHPLTGAAPLAAQDTARAAPVTGVRAADVLRAACVPLETTVDPAGREGAFRTIRAALRHAAEEDACAARIRLRPGEHRGSFSVDRDTEILGPEGGGADLRGTAGLRGPHRLVLRSLRIRGAGFPGAVSVAHSRARVELRDVTVVGARGHGVRMRGGRLVLRRVGIHATEAPPAHAGAGTAVLLEEGARARLEDVTLVGSAHQALVVRGRGTRARATGLRVTATGHRSSSPLPDGLLDAAEDALDAPAGKLPRGGARLPAPRGVAPSGGGAGDPAAGSSGDSPSAAADGRPDLDGVGAVEVAGGAILLAEDLQLFRNDFTGVHVHDGGRAHLRSGAIRGTSRAGERGGMNVAVVGGEAVLRGLALADADFVGLLVAEGARVLLEGSLVRGSDIGVALRSDLPLDCLRRDNRFADNGVNLDVARPPTPDGAEPGGGGGTPRARCARVPWR